MQTLSKNRGIGGTIKEAPEDFVVREITGKGIVLEPGFGYTAEQLKEEDEREGRFVTFVLQKRDWETIRAMLEIAKRLGRGRKSIGYAGTKDRRSISVQLASIYGVEPESLGGVRIKDIGINGAWRSNGIELGSNLGNAFSVLIHNPDKPEGIGSIRDELNGLFPNYFGRQRFGSRGNNFRIGMAILNDDLEEAALLFLTESGNESSEEASSARERLSRDLDFKAALEYFPRHLRYERTVIEHLSRYGNYANAIRKLPRGIALMFIHAVEALIFNASLERRVKENDYETGVGCGANFYGFPDVGNRTGQQKERGFPLGLLIGYETDERLIDEYESALLEELGINKDSFRIRSIPELSMRGSLRPLLAPFKDFSYEAKEGGVGLNFSLPAGSYATVLMNEFTKTENPDLGSTLGSVS